MRFAALVGLLVLVILEAVNVALQADARDALRELGEQQRATRSELVAAQSQFGETIVEALRQAEASRLESEIDAAASWLVQELRTSGREFLPRSADAHHIAVLRRHCSYTHEFERRLEACHEELFAAGARLVALNSKRGLFAVTDRAQANGASVADAIAEHDRQLEQAQAELDHVAIPRRRLCQLLLESPRGAISRWCAEYPESP